MEWIRKRKTKSAIDSALGITQDFMEAVKADTDWKLAFPVTEKEAKEDKLDLKDSSQVMWKNWPVEGKYLTKKDLENKINK